MSTSRTQFKSHLKVNSLKSYEQFKQTGSAKLTHQPNYFSALSATSINFKLDSQTSNAMPLQKLGSTVSSLLSLNAKTFSIAALNPPSVSNFSNHLELTQYSNFLENSDSKSSKSLTAVVNKLTNDIPLLEPAIHTFEHGVVPSLNPPNQLKAGAILQSSMLKNDLAHVTPMTKFIPEDSLKIFCTKNLVYAPKGIHGLEWGIGAYGCYHHNQHNGLNTANALTVSALSSAATMKTNIESVVKLSESSNGYESNATPIVEAFDFRYSRSTAQPHLSKNTGSHFSLAVNKLTPITEFPANFQLNNQLYSPMKIFSLRDKAFGFDVPDSICFNMRHYNTAIKPFSFSNTYLRAPLPSLERVTLLSVKDVRELKGYNKLIYVLSEDNELRIAKRNDIHFSVAFFPTFVLHHNHLAQDEKVILAGEILVENGNIRKIDNSSGHYKPGGCHLKHVTTKVFSDAGFGDLNKNFKYSNKSYPTCDNESEVPTRENRLSQYTKSTPRFSFFREKTIRDINRLFEIVFLPAEANAQESCQRPFYEDAASAFGKVDGYANFNKIGDMLGGKVKVNLDSGIFKNACALRGSWSLFNAPEVKQKSCLVPRLKKETVSGGDGLQYMYRLSTLINFLMQEWGPPDYNSRKKNQNMPREVHGVVIHLMPEAASIGFTGHFELSDYIPHHFDTLYWHLPTKPELVNERKLSSFK